MKSLNYALVSSLCALVIGILLVTWPDVAVRLFGNYYRGVVPYSRTGRIVFLSGPVEQE